MALSPLPLKSPLLDSQGLLSQTWANWLNGLFNLVSGSGDTSVYALDATVDALQTEVDALEATVAALDPEEGGGMDEQYLPVSE